MLVLRPVIVMVPANALTEDDRMSTPRLATGPPLSETFPLVEVTSALLRYTYPEPLKLTFPEALMFPCGSTFTPPLAVIEPEEDVRTPTP